MTQEEAIKKKKISLSSWFSKKENLEFEDFSEFYSWYTKQEKVCHYCKITEEDCRLIVEKGYLKSKRFPENGLITQGRARGMWLEIDRKNPNEKYSADNCVLACYFCNNDKSDVFNETQYLEFKENRHGFLQGLLKGNPE